MAKYRLLIGSHSETTFEYETDDKGVRRETKADTRVYTQGDCFESANQFLEEKHGKEKFQKLDDNYDISVHQAAQTGFRPPVPMPQEPAQNPVPQTPVDFNEWNEDELRAYAAEEEINIGNAKTKAALIKAISAAQAGGATT